MTIRKLAAATALVALTGCPYDETAADITAGDGGVWLGSPDDGGVFIPQSGDASNVVYLTQRPSTEKLCQLVIGDYAGIQKMTKPLFVGTWIGDVEESYLFGPPMDNAEQLGTDEATLSYHWQGGGIFLSFQFVQAFDTSSLPYLEPWQKSFFLRDISIEGQPYLDCWRAVLGYQGAVPCTECMFNNNLVYISDDYPLSAGDIKRNHEKYGTGK